MADHSRLEAAIGKAQSPYVDNHIQRTTRDGDEAKRRRCRASTSDGRHRSLARYNSATPADTCRRECWAYNQSTLVLWASTADGGVEWCGHTSV